MWCRHSHLSKHAHTTHHSHPPHPTPPTHSWQAWALLEEEEGRVEDARRLFRRASRADPSHLPVWQAWGCAEFRAGNYEQVGACVCGGVRYMSVCVWGGGASGSQRK